MSGGYMFSQFVSIINQIISYFMIDKYLWFLIPFFVGLCLFLIKIVLRWFNA